MSAAAAPCFVVIEVPDLVAARAGFAGVRPTIESAGGTVLASALPRDVQVLEAGTSLAAVLIARWPAEDMALAWWRSAHVQAAVAPILRLPGSRAVAVRGVPGAGLGDDFLPTAANVHAPRLETPPAYMLVQGSITNVPPIEQYAAIIMPMLRERYGYYVVYAEAPDVRVLHGHWAEQAYIVSRWPTLAAAQDFWTCDRYQDLAIPTRTGHGAFTVLLMPGLAG
jgi:uncharacterized protein (DUF1330 family)